MALKPRKIEPDSPDSGATNTEASTVATAKASEIKAPESAARPVKLKAAQYRIRNPHTNVMYYPHVPTDLIDLNAESAFFERAQVQAGVLIILEG